MLWLVVVLIALFFLIRAFCGSRLVDTRRGISSDQAYRSTFSPDPDILPSTTSHRTEESIIFLLKIPSCLLTNPQVLTSVSSCMAVHSLNFVVRNKNHLILFLHRWLDIKPYCKFTENKLNLVELLQFERNSFSQDI